MQHAIAIFIFRSLIFSFLHIYIHVFYHTRIHWSFMLNCSELQRFPVCTCLGSFYIILSSADFVNDRRIVLSGLDTFQIFLFVWNIMLEFEKKHSCNSILRKSIDYLISYLDIFTLQKFDPTYLQAFLSIETIATLWNEIFPLKCNTSL